MKRNILLLIAASIFSVAQLFAEIVNVHVEDSNGDPLSGVVIRYNNFGTNTVPIGNTDANGNLVADVADALRFFRGVKNSSSQDIAGPGDGGSITFQTSTFTSHVIKSDGVTDFAGVQIRYNNFGVNYVVIGTTDANGLASTELFPGTYNFRAIWNSSIQTGSLTIGSSGVEGTILFRTSKFIAHVTKSDGVTNFAGVQIRYNNFGTNYIVIGTTDSDGNAATELFAGNYNFKAVWNSTEQVAALNVGSPGASGTVEFQTAEFISHVSKSDNTDFPGVQIRYNNFGTNYVVVGTTDGSGNVSTELFPGNYNFRATWNSSSQSGSLEVPASGASGVLQFKTAKATALVTDCDNGNLLQGVNIRYNNFGTNYISMGNTDVSGEVSFELFPGNYNIRSVTNSSTSAIEVLALPASGATVEFNPTRVCFVYSGLVRYNNFGTNYVPFNCNTYLYPGTYNFKFDGQIKAIDISGCALTGGLITLVDEAGNPLANYPADYPGESRNLKWKYRCGGSWGPTTSFQTDADGQTFFTINCASNNWDERIRMTLNQTTLEQDVSVNSTFQAARVNVNLKNCDGLITDVPGGTVAQGGGYWYGHGTTGGTGTYSLYTFPSSIKIRMNYNHGSQTLFPIIAAGTNEVDFLTTSVTYNYSNDIKSNKGGSWWLFDKPTMNLIPGDYNFYFKDGGVWNGPAVVTVGGCTINQSPVIMKLIDSDGDGISGGLAKYYKSGWKTVGTTGANGIVMAFIEGSVGNLPFKMYHAGSSNQKSQDVSVNSVVVFQTELVSMQLVSSAGVQLTSDNAKYYASGWKTFGNGTTATSMELLPNNYPFKVYYKGGSKQMSQNVGVDPMVIFETELVSMELKSSTGIQLASDNAKYYASGWKTFGSGTTSTSMELLPNNYPFKVYYKGGSKQMSQNVGDDPVVIFETELVSMELKSSTGIQLASDNAKYYASGWKTFGSGTTSTSMELLPNNYPFKVYYKGGTKQKSQDVGVDPVVIFETELISMELKSSAGVQLSSDNAKYYASGWKTFGSGTTPTNMELLPATYPFKVYYKGGSQQKNQDVGVDPLVTFETIEVTMKLLDGDANEVASDNAKYYASGWKTFGTGVTTTTMEMLAANYPFKVYLNGGSMQKSQNVGVDPIVIFTGISVEIQYTGVIKYYASGWKTYSNPTALLPGNYPFRFYDAAGTKSIQKTLAISGSEYKKSAAYVRLRTSTGSPISGASSQYYQSGWKNIDATNSNGAALALIDGHVGTLPFRMFYGGGSLQKNQNIAADSQVEFQTELVSMELVTSLGAPLVSSDAQYYASGWKTFGSGSTLTSMELLPGTYPFRVFYKGASRQKNQNVGVDPLVSFATELVSMELVSSLGVPLLSSNAEYYASGWKTFGSGVTQTSMELLPITYPFRVFYGGASVQKNQNVGVDPLVSFATELVSMELISSLGDPLLSSNAEYYASGWKTFGTGATATSMELLPNNYPFRVFYEGASQQKSQNISGGNSPVVFTTTLMNVRLEDDVTASPIDGGIVQYYASGWKSFGTTGDTAPGEAEKELLPGTIPFRLTYGGDTKQKNGTMSGATSFLIFTWDGLNVERVVFEEEKRIIEDNLGQTPNSPDLELEGFEVGNNYPNPFYQFTVIDYSLSVDRRVSLIVYDISGKQVKILVDGMKQSGDHRVEWDARNDNGQVIAGGTYYYRLKVGNVAVTKGMVHID